MAANPDADRWSPERVEAELGWSAERERLEHRIQELEAEVDKLHTTLADVITTAAAGINPANRSISPG